MQRASEKVLGQYLERIAQSVPGDLGKRPHAFKLNDPAFLKEDFDTEFGHVLKQGVERFIEKIEVLAHATHKNKCFK